MASDEIYSKELKIMIICWDWPLKSACFQGQEFGSQHPYLAAYNPNMPFWPP